MRVSCGREAPRNVLYIGAKTGTSTHSAACRSLWKRNRNPDPHPPPPEARYTTTASARPRFRACQIHDPLQEWTRGDDGERNDDVSSARRVTGKCGSPPSHRATATSGPSREPASSVEEWDAPAALAPCLAARTSIRLSFILCRTDPPLIHKQCMEAGSSSLHAPSSSPRARLPRSSAPRMRDGLDTPPPPPRAPPPPARRAVSPEDVERPPCVGDHTGIGEGTVARRKSTQAHPGRVRAVGRDDDRVQCVRAARKASTERAGWIVLGSKHLWKEDTDVLPVPSVGSLADLGFVYIHSVSTSVKASAVMEQCIVERLSSEGGWCALQPWGRRIS
ncbi:hypothetical protein DFH07DRAFT_777371 [Mycena maculata]|uniref:Uncharacterized protein n=1 Tax=Mycena maculata TaxID=230809 RepID=A0AAD7IHW0_9AGAR|nr:hypothetical protein DFH07DRAFT_777371 [Mycena maculata]